VIARHRNYLRFVCLAKCVGYSQAVPDSPRGYMGGFHLEWIGPCAQTFDEQVRYANLFHDIEKLPVTNEN
jgi:hypothetical protein